MKEMIGGCCVCSDESGWDENPLVYCDGEGCNVAVHQACYGIVSVPSGPWFCRKCESQERTARLRCELCPGRGGALKRTDTNGWAHVVCALYIPEVRFGDVSTMEPILVSIVPPDRFNKVCCLCEMDGRAGKSSLGACMSCNKPGCRQSFHVTCAQAGGLLCEEQVQSMNNVTYCGYCPHHYAKLQKRGHSVKPIPAFRPLSVSGAGGPGGDNCSSTPECSPEKQHPAVLHRPARPPSSQLQTMCGVDAATTAAESAAIVSAERRQKRVKASSRSPRSTPSADAQVPVKRETSPPPPPPPPSDNGLHAPPATVPPTDTSDVTVGSAGGAISTTISETADAGNDASAAHTASTGLNFSTNNSGSMTGVVSIKQEPMTVDHNGPVTGDPTSPGHAGSMPTDLSTSTPPLSAVSCEARGAGPTPPLAPSTGDQSHSSMMTSSFVPDSGVIIKSSIQRQQQQQQFASMEHVRDGVMTSSHVTPSPSPPSLPSSSASSSVSVLVAPSAAAAAVNVVAGSALPSVDAVRTDLSPALPAPPPNAVLSVAPASSDVAAGTGAVTAVVSPVKMKRPRSATADREQRKRKPPGRPRRRVSPSSSSSSVTGGAAATEQTTADEMADMVGAAHVLSSFNMLGNHLNPHSSMARKLSDSLASEVAEHVANGGATPVAPSTDPQPAVAASQQQAPLVGPAIRASSRPAGSSVSAFPQTLSELLERQWLQGSQFLMEQAHHFDISALLSCLHQLRRENDQLEDHLSSLVKQRDHLLAVHARLSVSLDGPSPSSSTGAAGTASTTSVTSLRHSAIRQSGVPAPAPAVSVALQNGVMTADHVHPSSQQLHHQQLAAAPSVLQYSTTARHVPPAHSPQSRPSQQQQVVVRGSQQHHVTLPRERVAPSVAAVGRTTGAASTGSLQYPHHAAHPQAVAPNVAGMVSSPVSLVVGASGGMTTRPHPHLQQQQQHYVSASHHHQQQQQQQQYHHHQQVVHHAAAPSHHQRLVMASSGAVERPVQHRLIETLRVTPGDGGSPGGGSYPQYQMVSPPVAGTAGHHGAVSLVSQAATVLPPGASGLLASQPPQRHRVIADKR